MGTFNYAYIICGEGMSPFQHASFSRSGALCDLHSILSIDWKPEGFLPLRVGDRWTRRCGGQAVFAAYRDGERARLGQGGATIE